MDWTPDLPTPASDNWRFAYGAKKADENDRARVYYPADKPEQTSYQAPGKEPIPFVYDSMKLSGGFSVDTAEYPFFGLWSSTQLNEKPQGITVTGFLRGDEYIKDRNALVEDLRVITTDKEPGFLSLPLWGRFPVIVVDWDVEEAAKELGQCKISITFTRAGYPHEERQKLEVTFGDLTNKAADRLKDIACKVYEKKMADQLEQGSFVNAFSLVKDALIGVVGRVQATISTLNDITNSVSQISNLLAQGIHNPKDLALALFSAAGKIVTSLASIKNTSEETVAFFRIKNNEKNIAFAFLANDKYSLPMEAATIKQQATKTATEQLYKTASLYVAALVLPTIENQTYENMLNMFGLYDRLENTIDLNDPELYFAVNELRSAVAKTLAEKQLSQELSITLNSSMPILALAKYLGTTEFVLRELNRIADSFVVNGEVRYV